MLNLLTELVISGGFVMPPLMIGSALLWFGLYYRYQSLNKGSHESLDRLMSYNFKTNDSLYLTYLTQIKNNRKEDAPVTLAEAYTEFSKFDVMTSTVVMVAPLLGLLGTVSGMIETFASLGDMSLFTQSGGIAGGISQALVSTQMGLAVAIPGLVIGRILKRKQSALMSDLERAVEILWGHGENHA